MTVQLAEVQVYDPESILTPVRAFCFSQRDIGLHLRQRLRYGFGEQRYIPVRTLDVIERRFSLMTAHRIFPRRLHPSLRKGEASL